jgi:hypothetical protein
MEYLRIYAQIAASDGIESKKFIESNIVFRNILLSMNFLLSILNQCDFDNHATFVEL